MSASRNVQCLAFRSRSIYCRHLKWYSTNASVKPQSGSKEIVVPYNIKRGPTDLLKALATTISKDYTAPLYKYEDDPYLIPQSNLTKRSFALSKESGRKAARYFLETYPELFKCNKSEPHIKAFDPPVVYTENDEVTPETLKECIQDFDVQNAINVYNILKKKDMPVNQQLKQDLLELLCFYNSSQPPTEEYCEERFYQKHDEGLKEKWNTKGMAEKLFQDMEQDSMAYSAMIAGASKYQDINRASALYEEMRSKELCGTVDAYNGLISIVPFIQGSSDSRWEYAMNLMSCMNSEGISPNLYTMNALLSLISKTRRWKRAQNLAFNILAEMKRLSIEPSLGTYYLLLTIANTNEAPNTNILPAIMNTLEGKELTIRHPLDVYFFAASMEMCFKVNQDKDLAYRIHNLLEYKSNCKLLGNSLPETYYFKSFFRLLCELEDLDKFMEIYEKYVPNTYTPEPSVMLPIIECVHFSGLYKYLPRLCSDVLLFDQTERENILNILMEGAGCMKHEEQIQRDLVHLIWNIVEKINKRIEIKKTIFNWTGPILGNILWTFMNGEDLEKSWFIMTMLVQNEENIIGHPESDCLLKFCELNLIEKNYERISVCVKYAVNGVYPDFRDDLQKLVSEMLQNQKLDTKEKVHIDCILEKASSMEDDTSTSDSSSDDSSSSDDENVSPLSTVPKM